MGNYSERRAMLMSQTHYRIHYLLSFRNQAQALMGDISYTIRTGKSWGTRGLKLIFSVSPFCRLPAKLNRYQRPLSVAVRKACLVILATCLLSGSGRGQANRS